MFTPAERQGDFSVHLSTLHPNSSVNFAHSKVPEWKKVLFCSFAHGGKETKTPPKVAPLGTA